jgi:hypothetical protein
MTHRLAPHLEGWLGLLFGFTSGQLIGGVIAYGRDDSREARRRHGRGPCSAPGPTAAQP